MPQPVSFSTSMLPHLRPVSLYSRCCQGPSAVIVTVFAEQHRAGVGGEVGCALNYSAIAADSERIVDQSSPP